MSNGAYARTALMRGLQIGQSVKANPFQFGMIGSTGSHTGLASADEDYFWGSGALPLRLGKRASERGIGPGAPRLERARPHRCMGRREHTHFDLRRLQTQRGLCDHGSPDSCSVLWRLELHGEQARKANMVGIGYTFGHPMGSDLTKRPEDKAPSFLMYAVKDPDSANLDRIQMIKGWVDTEGKRTRRCTTSHGPEAVSGGPTGSFRQ